MSVEASPPKKDTVASSKKEQSYTSFSSKRRATKPSSETGQEQSEIAHS
jgi:hypothetical protein